jgi:hypothetical protein
MPSLPLAISAFQPEPSHHAQHSLVRPYGAACAAIDEKNLAAPNVIGVILGR